MNHDLEDHDRGLAFDLPRLMSRRRALSVLTGSVATAALAACGSSPKQPATTSEATAEIPDETAGPYPGDGSNGPNVLTESGVVRSEITKSFGDASGVAQGIPASIEMTLLDVAAGGTPPAGAAVYLWHWTIAGQYSIYDQEVAGHVTGCRVPADAGRACRNAAKFRPRVLGTESLPESPYRRGGPRV